VQQARFVERAVYLPEADALVLSDLHIGRDERSAVTLPLGERKDLRERLTTAVERFEPTAVVFAGDILHEFRGASLGTAQSLEQLAAICERAGATPSLVVGNHDPLLPSVWSGEVHDAVTLEDGTVVCHGHEVPDAGGERYVIGHDHPVIEVEGTRRPCFLWGPGEYRGADLLMLPSFTRLAAGVPVDRLASRGFQSPLVTDPNALRPIVADGDEPLRFPPIGEFRSLL
jgi:putative SbcD/Mre11-related phosphoesterase